ncbi:MAG: hypothetical protein K6T85_14835 [Gorillibacterium sp.]|nr:hypothetical protein [Gorillibacterium sp.]
MTLVNEDSQSLTTYDEAVQAVERAAILPLADSVPDHPSISALTPSTAWHTGLASDPWQWRVRFPVEGKAAYGKFFRQKAILIAPDLFPYLKAWTYQNMSVSERYDAGLLPKEAVLLFEVIEEAGEIDTRELRVRAGMKAKERKADFERGMLILQESLEIVITGVKEKLNLDGEKSGWSSMSYGTADYWMHSKGIEPWTGDKETARKYIIERLNAVCSQKAIAFFNKLYGLNKLH